jgi:hypothetical protein
VCREHVDVVKYPELALISGALEEVLLNPLKP